MIGVLGLSISSSAMYWALAMRHGLVRRVQGKIVKVQTYQYNDKAGSFDIGLSASLTLKRSDVN